MDVMDGMIERRERGYVSRDRGARGDGVPSRLRDARGAARRGARGARRPPARVGAQLARGTSFADRVYGPELMARYCAPRRRARASCLAVRRRDRRRRWTSSSASSWRRYPGHRDRRRLLAAAPAADRAEEQAELAERINADRAGRRLGRDRRAQAGEVDGADAARCWRRRCWSGVGAAFDFIAGRKRQAPAWMQRRGLEWLFRLSQEPRAAGAPLPALQPRVRGGVRAPVHCAGTSPSEPEAAGSDVRTTPSSTTSRSSASAASGCRSR